MERLGRGGIEELGLTQLTFCGIFFLVFGNLRESTRLGSLRTCGSDRLGLFFFPNLFMFYGTFSNRESLTLQFFGMLFFILFDESCERGGIFILASSLSSSTPKKFSIMSRKLVVAVPQRAAFWRRGHHGVNEGLASQEVQNIEEVAWTGS